MALERRFMSGYLPAPMIESSNLRERAQAWLQEDQDPQTHAQLESLLEEEDDSVLADCFDGYLQFGTAGLRGLLGPGPNRMNRVIIRRATAGLARYLRQEVDVAKERGVVIGRDGRTGSRSFAEDTAAVFLGAGFKVYMFEDLVPTPLVSYATRELRAAGAVMITASHNPPEYNGYKVFWETGGQIVPPHDKGISAAMDEVGRTDQLPMSDLETARKEGRLEYLGEEIFSRYLDGVMGLCVHPEAPSSSGLVLAYTPLHGIGAPLTERALAKAGFENVHVVPEQREPDKMFPTVKLPNPEEAGAMDMVQALGEKVGADIALAADPDGDRLGVALPNGPDGGWQLLGGDEIGVLLAHYLMCEGRGGSERALATSIVSSSMLKAMAEQHKVHYLDTLTGLKWIVDATLRHKAEHGSKLVVGYESALGYMVGELVHDKDGISAATIFAEMAAWLKIYDRTVWDYLDEAYRRYGLFLNRTISLVFPPIEADRIDEIVTKMRGRRVEKIGQLKVERTVDYEKDETDLPPANLLLYELEGGARVLVRPSGTEPKLKSYYEVKEPVASNEPMANARARATEALDELEKAHQAMLASMK